jgi:hypothetical protein
MFTKEERELFDLIGLQLGTAIDKLKKEVIWLKIKKYIQIFFNYNTRPNCSSFKRTILNRWNYNINLFEFLKQILFYLLFR